ncbi:MAG: MotA/TolQ/ExbB proton channel family protein [Candidatus Rokubacteria bacterium]|nr:MotA/TolQ/ExbB proton channel family protein [Candidatus Rokubacteria bacterium]MBI3825996.1 MotA/TolQ/ExbB proton channel family protein [Candidatus Rokubacteria bacterium]
MLDIVLHAGLIAKAILVILLLFSIVSWALILDKWWQFRRVRSQTLGFLRIFREGRRSSAVYAAARKYRESPLAHLYVAAYQEVAGVPEVADVVLDDVDEGLGGERLEQANRALRRASTLEVARLERYLPFLATTASATPFIGLFGTVWGIITAFHGIGLQGSASLAVVAPGISEALIATAFGLGAAIPAVVGYNYFVNRVKHWAAEMEGFALDLLNVLSRPAPKIAGRPAKDGL